MAFLPVSKEEMLERGWDRPDFVYICGDAYVDHPSFGAAIICRVLESQGYKVCFIAQPDWKTTEDFTRFGEPRLAFLVSAGNIDSMVNHYTVAKKRRKKDSYSPGGEMGLRPDRATIVYCNKLREVYKKTPIIIGGIEASLRRLSHYDYWDNKVRRSILLDSGADLLLYGMGEHQIIEMADALNSGLSIKDLTFIRGTVYKTKSPENVYDGITLPDFDTIRDARGVIYSIAGNEVTAITEYSNAKELACDFLLFMATDEANEVYSTSNYGTQRVFNWNLKEKAPELDSYLSENYGNTYRIQQDRAKMWEADNAYVLPWYANYPLYVYGNLKALNGDYENFEATYIDAGRADVHAEDIWQNSSDYWTMNNNNRWNTALRNAGLA